MSILRYHHTVTWVDRFVTLAAFLLCLVLACIYNYFQMPIMTVLVMFLAIGGALANDDSRSITVASFSLWFLVAISFLT